MAHRLVTELAQIHDRQPRMNQPDVVNDLNPRVVRTTVGKRVAHRR
jgi:hypothetical protein